MKLREYPKYKVGQQVYCVGYPRRITHRKWSKVLKFWIYELNGSLGNFWLEDDLDPV